MLHQPAELERRGPSRWKYLAKRGHLPDTGLMSPPILTGHSCLPSACWWCARSALRDITITKDFAGHMAAFHLGDRTQDASRWSANMKYGRVQSLIGVFHGNHGKHASSQRNGEACGLVGKQRNRPVKFERHPAITRIRQS